MSIAYQSISTFRHSLAKLIKKEKHGYHSCPKDICERFCNLTFEDIWEMDVRLREMGDVRIIKVRIGNSCATLSKSDGFRLIICCHRKFQSVTFLNVFPKRGHYGQLDQMKNEYKHQAEEFAKEHKNGALILHNIQNNLKEVVSENSLNCRS